RSLQRRWRKEWAPIELLQHFKRLRPQLRREVDHIGVSKALTLKGWWFGWEWLRLGAALTRRGGRRDRAFFDWPDRGSGFSIEHVHEPLLADLRHRVDPPAVDGDVDEDRRRREVVVPETVMDTLKMPDAPACRG